MSEEFSVDFSEAVERRLLPTDWYRVRVDSLEIKKSKKSGTPMASILLRVVGGPYDQQPLFTNWMLAGVGAGITKGGIRAFLGDVAVERTSFSKTDLLGAQAIARVVQEVWAEEEGGDGELQNRVSKYKAVEYTVEEGTVEGLFSE
jgi:hypothetical protein